MTDAVFQRLSSVWDGVTEVRTLKRFSRWVLPSPSIVCWPSANAKVMFWPSESKLVTVNRFEDRKPWNDAVT
jgi:hypothetical protein